MCATLDTYGFALSGLTDDEHYKREVCLRRSTSHSAAWEKTLDQRQIRLAGRRGKDMVRRGIPPHLRPQVWMALSGAQTYKGTYPRDYYTELVSQSSDAETPVDAETVQLFIRNLGTQGVATVQRILAAFRAHSDSEGAASGLSSILAFLVTVVGQEREEDVFWLFFGFWCRLQERVLKALIETKNPLLADQIEKFASLQGICDGWFSSLFVTTFPSETVARIWDCIFCEGPKVLHRIALATLFRNQNTILSMSHSVKLPMILTYKLRRTFDAHDLLTTAFRSVGSMRSSTIAWIGQQAEREIRGEPLLPLNRSWKRRSFPTYQ